jgi:general secretion pathway protein K
MSRATERGVALVLVLWLVVLLTVIVGSHAYNAHVETRLAENRVQLAKARGAAEAGVHRGILELFNPLPNERWLADGSPHSFLVEGTRVEVALRDTAGLVDLNRASPVLLRALLVVLGLDDEARDTLVDLIQDWRDTDDLRRLYGAEDRDYRLAGRAFEAKDAPFDTVHELRYVMSVRPGDFDRLAPYLTVHSGLAGINPAFAPPELLALLPGADPEAVQAYVAERAATGRGGSLAGLGGQQFFVDQESRVYEVSATAVSPQGVTARVSAVVEQRTSGEASYVVREWRER